eukprot:TRINITY_DN1644_c2_g1_i1.p1 TRINITY_DN1644_c2_g1~~TRINITY_DN1644_c2_g1_i1.p1  ORF type:complete len:305 (-),score=57.64 TRINITY_DN1644_c2_g1_i1:870-1784(-)
MSNPKPQPLGSLFYGKQKSQQQQQPKSGKPTGPRYAVMLESLNKKIAQEFQESGQVVIKGLKKEFQRLILKIKDLEAQKKTAEEDFSNVKDQLLRLTSDFENFRKRAEADKKDATNRAKSSLVEDLLPLIDNFELASNQLQINTEMEQKIHNSYQGLYKQMIDKFSGFGVSAVESVGHQFDPCLHEAVMREANNDVEDGTVVEEFRKGFTVNGKLIRPAMVKVSFREESEVATTSNSSNNDDQLVESSQQQETPSEKKDFEQTEQTQTISENGDKQEQQESNSEAEVQSKTGEQTSIKADQTNS